jgi:hypothetical protein
MSGNRNGALDQKWGKSKKDKQNVTLKIKKCTN